MEKAKEFIKKPIFPVIVSGVFFLYFVYLFVKIWGIQVTTPLGGGNLSKFMKLNFIFILVSFMVISAFIYLKDLSIHIAYLIVSLSIGISFMFMIPPYASQDASTHINTAYMISNRILGFDTSDKVDYIRECDTQSESGLTDVIGRGSYLALANNMTKKPSSTKIIEIDKRTVLHEDICYLPSGLGIAIVRLFKGNYLIALLVGTFFSLLVNVLYTSYAIYKAPFGKTLMMLLAMFPMSFQQYASMCRDGIVNAAVFTVFALGCKFRFSKDKKIKKSEIVMLCVSAIILIVGKGSAYSPILLFPVLIQIKKEHFTKRNIAIAVGVLVLGIVAVEWYAINRLPDQGNYVSFYGENAYSLKSVITDPVMGIQLIGRTINKYGDRYLKETIGFVLGRYQMPIATKGLYLFELLWIVGLFNIEGRDRDITVTNRIMMALMGLLLFLAALAAMTFFWTPASRDVIEGVQGRYLIPGFLPFILAFTIRKPLVRKDLSKYYLSAIYISNIYVMFYGFMAGLFY